MIAWKNNKLLLFLAYIFESRGSSMVERSSEEAGVGGSIPSRGT